MMTQSTTKAAGTDLNFHEQWKRLALRARQVVRCVVSPHASNEAECYQLLEELLEHHKAVNSAYEQLVNVSINVAERREAFRIAADACRRLASFYRQSMRGISVPGLELGEDAELWFSSSAERFDRYFGALRGSMLTV